MDTTNTVFDHESLYPLFVSAVLADEVAAQRVKNTLQQRGFNTKHFEGMKVLTGSASTLVAKTVVNGQSPEQSNKLLHAVRILGRCDRKRGRVDGDDLTVLANCLHDSGLPQPVQEHLARAWVADGATDRDALADIFTVISKHPHGLPKKANFESLLKRWLKQTTWEPLLDYRQHGHVLLQPLTSGAALLSEGSVMGHCLKDVSHAYRYARYCCNRQGEVLHLSLVNNPIQAATLSVRMRRVGSDGAQQFKQTDLEAVNQGTAHPAIEEAAKVVVNRLNQAYGLPAVVDDNDEDDDLIVDLDD